jgi:hypothetical protein
MTSLLCLFEDGVIAGEWGLKMSEFFYSVIDQVFVDIGGLLMHDRRKVLDTVGDVSSVEVGEVSYEIAVVFDFVRVEGFGFPGVTEFTEFVKDDLVFLFDFVLEGRVLHK